MKRLIFSSLVVVAAIIFSAAFTSCKDTDPNDGGKTDRLIAGKFASPNGGNAVFYADYVSAVGVKAASESERELVGKIEDGDIVFNLKGIFNETTHMFFLSAGSSILIYQIVGTLTDGEITNSEATIKVKLGNEWIIHTVSITSAEDITIVGSVSNQQVEGIPQKWHGTWVEDVDGNLMITSYQMILIDEPHRPMGFLDIVSLGDNKYEMVWESLQPMEDEFQIMYIKAWIEEIEQGLLVTHFYESMSDTYALTAAFDTTTADDPEMQGEFILTRP